MAEFKKRGRPLNQEVIKEARKANFLKKVFNGDEGTKTSSFLKRKPTLMKKAKELETLCGIEVCIVCFDANGSVDYWPHNEWEAKKRCSFYLGLSKKEKKEWDYFDYLESKKKKLNKKESKKKSKISCDAAISDLGNWVNGLEGNLLENCVTGLESRVKSLRERIELLNKNKVVTATEQEDSKCFNDKKDSEDIFSVIHCLGDGNDLSFRYFQQENYMMHKSGDYNNYLISGNNQAYDVAPISQLPFSSY